MARNPPLQVFSAVLAVVAICHGAWAAAQTPASTAGAVSSARNDSLSEVTVTGTRSELEKKASDFVSHIAASENGEGLPRWRKPVCPLVSGLPEKDGEFILERLTGIAHEASVPLAGEKCPPNLYILISSQPEELLRGMEKRNRAFTFGFDRSHYPPTPMPAALVDDFITTARPVRVWYGSTEEDAAGKPLAYCQSRNVLAHCAGVVPNAACDPNLYYQCGVATAGGSHLVFNTIWEFSRVFVVVDENRLHGVTMGQLADYVAMVAFAKLKPDALLGDAPTILTLFNEGSQSVPTAMTIWDQAFLKSVYATEQTSRTQRGQMAHSIVEGITH